MKRRSDNILNQPVVNKPDVSTSTDLRSKISAKLSTLLWANRVQLLRKRRDYLLGEPEQHSQIIIDPTIVIKTETPEPEDCIESTPSTNSSNFLLSAKSRITELLNKSQGGNNKYKNCGKENSNSISDCSPVSSVSSASTSTSSLQAETLCNFQSRSCSSLSKKRKLSSNKNCPDASSSDVLKNQVHLRNMVVVVEDVMKNRTRLSRSSSKKSTNDVLSSSPRSGSRSRKFSDKHQQNRAAKDHVINEIFKTTASCDTNLPCTVSETSKKSNSSRNIISNCRSSESINSKSSNNPGSQVSSKVDDIPLIPDVVDLGEILIAPEPPEPVSNHIEDDSELVDDPFPLNSSSVSSQNHILNNENSEPDVVLLCEKVPTHEVITLEDNDDSDDILEEVHECAQCGKTFRLQSLLNFHIKMHGTDILSCSRSSTFR